jgi:2-keto-4-pentenoate hydratase/2-oxohepta-3-ene-1,7-dioic acid hydratase in catechol pathway
MHDLSFPTPFPSIFGIGRNYEEHARELGNAIPQGEPVVFLKAGSSIREINRGETAYPQEEIHFEAELVLRIGKKLPWGNKSKGWDAIDAIALGLDLTRRNKQAELKSKGLPWTLAKSFHGASILSPFVPVRNLKSDQFFEFNFYLNGNLKQKGDTRKMIFDVPYLLDFLASNHSLIPGDLIFTGTPEGVGPMKKGDKFCLELINPQHKWEGVL